MTIADPTTSTLDTSTPAFDSSSRDGVTASATNGIASAAEPAKAPRDTWAIAGLIAGAAGVTATLGGLQSSQKIMDAAAKGDGVIDLLSQRGYHVAVNAGFVVVMALLFTAAGWRRWAVRRAPDSLPARVMSMAFTASAGSAMLGYGLYGSLSMYLKGGSDFGTFPREALYAVYAVVDFAPLIAWWGVTVAALCMVWLAFRDRLLPRWMGVLSAIAALIPLSMLGIFGLPGMFGLVGPLWLAAISIGMVARRRA